jgi:hypothetical protein
VHQEISGLARIPAGFLPGPRATEIMLDVEHAPAVRTSLARILKHQESTVPTASCEQVLEVGQIARRVRRVTGPA